MVYDPQLEETDLENIDLFSTKAEIVNYLLLRYLLNSNEPVGSWLLKVMLEQKNIIVSTATVGRFLKNLDGKGYTELMGTQGRVITKSGVHYIKKQSEKVLNEKLQKEMMSAARPKNIQELLDLYTTRRLLECEAARLAASRADSAIIDALEQSIQSHEMCIHNSTDPTIPALHFHGKVAEASNIRFLIASLDILFNEETSMESRILEITKERSAEYALQHKLIAQAIKDGDPDEAENQMRIHMDSMIAALTEQVSHFEEMRISKKDEQ